MYRNTIQKKRGQALIMVTFSMLLIFGMLGLVVDLGWGYFVQRSAQAAADSAALAAVRKAYSTLGQGTYTCGTDLTCQPTPISCQSLDTSSNLYNGCQYAQRNFQTGSSSRQNLMISSGTGSTFTTASGNVAVKYWVTVTAAQQTPQLFSAIFGNMMLTSAARATAGIVKQIGTNGSLVLLNRRKDHTVLGNVDYYGLNLLVQANDNQGQYALQTSGLISMSSTCAGTSLGQGDCQAGNKPAYAGVNQGGGTVFSPQTAIAGNGWYDVQGSSKWTQTPTNGATAADDPMSGKGQPPIPKVGTEVPVPGGVIDNTICPSGICQPGKYYATTTQSCGTGCTQQVASGAALTVNGSIRFANSNFDGYIFFGGLTGTGGTITFEPGIYAIVGAQAAANGSPGALLNTSTNLNLVDNTTSTGPNTDAGELFIFTGVDSKNNFSYPGLSGQVPQAVLNNPSPFQMGTINLQSGNNSTTINLHGLNPDSSAVQIKGYETFAPTLIWQDQTNSSVQYDSKGNVDTSCGNLDNPCTHSLTNNSSPEFDIQASPNIHLYGIIYQPRGAWTTLIGGGGYASPLQLITGAVNVQGNANIDLLSLSRSLTRTVATLIE